MRTIILLISFSWAVSAFAIPPSYDNPPPRQTVTVHYLIEACSIVGDPASEHGMIAFFDCQSYSYGVIDTYLAIRKYIPKEIRACFPESLPPWEALNMVRHEWEADLTKGQLDADQLMIELLRKKYPCT